MPMMGVYPMAIQDCEQVLDMLAEGEMIPKGRSSESFGYSGLEAIVDVVC
jgi:hypothetical protein